MKTILVSGASTIVGYGILQSLKSSGENIKLIGTSIYDDSVAPGFCDVFFKAPLTSDDKYIDWLVKIIADNKIDLIIPGIDADLYKWSENSHILKQTNTKILINTPELIQLCKDKWTFYNHLIKTNTINSIQSSLSDNFDKIVAEFGLPLLLKPRHGFGSKGIVRVYDNEIFLKHKNKIGTVLMVQPLIGNDDEEYTTSAFCDGKGGFYAFMTLKRKLSKDGFTEKGEVVDLENIKETLESLCKIFKPLGPTNFQFRKHNGVLKLLEINPRISSSTSIRSKFGYNESHMAIDYFLNEKEIVQPIIRKGKAFRYIEDFIIYE